MSEVLGADKLKPVELEFKSAIASTSDVPVNLRTFSSYNFERNILVPASPFRFTAPGIDKALRQSIRSGDTVQLYAVNSQNQRFPIGTGFVDETDTHIQPQHLEYVVTGRDTVGQLVDNAAIDAQNRVINITQTNLSAILSYLIKNTRIPPGFKAQQVPNGPLLWQTNPGETKINVLQRYLDFTNTLIWSQPNGQLVLGKPDFTQDRQGFLKINSFANLYSPNNVLEARSKRSVNHAIRQIVVQLSTLGQVDAGSFTNYNADPEVQARAKSGVGRSVYISFSYGEGADAVNTVTQVGNQSGSIRQIGNEKALREIAKENMKILDVECVVRGHFNENNIPYNIDQIYNVQIEDDSIHEDMYVYACTYELTMEHGLITRLKLCKLGTICAYADQIRRSVT